ncbi:MAG: glycosyltransferase, partial [Acidimicrobiales bacterium]
MRILVLTNMFPPHSFGGYELWCRDVLRRWRRAGHEVLVLTSDVCVPGAEGEEEPGVEVRRTLHLYWDDHVILDPPLRRRLRWERANQRQLEAALSSHRPEVASAWAMGAMSLGLLARLGELGVPVVSVVCDEWPIYGPQVDAWSRVLASRPRLAVLVRVATGLPARLPDLDVLGPTCFVSEAMRSKARRLSRWEFPRSAVVPSGIDLIEFPLTRGHRNRPWRWRLLHVGRVDPRKGLRTIIEAFAACPGHATLEMLGDGDQAHLQELRALAGRLGGGGRGRVGRCDRA